MNFREYATKIRTQAAAAASKIPTFDDMAAKDDYIHSEEFNVRGQKKNQKQDTVHLGKSSESAGVSSNIERRHATEPWSLLDGRGLSSRPTEDASISKSKGEIQLQNYPVLQHSDETETQGDSKSSLSRDREPGNGTQSNPVLSVVAQAMASQHSKPQSAFSDDSTDSGNFMDSDGSSVDDSISEEGSTNDPILSLMRAENGHKQPSQKYKRSKSHRQGKSSHRFMSDLEERLASPEQADEVLANMTDPIRGAPATQPIFPILKSPIGSWVQGVAQRQFQRLVRKSDETKVEEAPLARQPMKRPIVKAPEEEFHTTVSSSVLADDELAALAQLKSSSNMSSFAKLYHTFAENRQFGFILFTLILAGYLFFFQRDEDSVT